MSTNTKGKAAAAAKPATQTVQVTIVAPGDTPIPGAQVPGGQAEGTEQGTAPGGAEQVRVSMELQGEGALQGDNALQVELQEQQTIDGGADGFKATRQYRDEELFIVQSAMLHDGEPYLPGERIQLTEKAAQPLLKIGAISED